MENNIVVRKLEEIGTILPVGIVEKENLNKSFSIRELTPAIEREFGRFKKDNKGVSETQEVTKLLSLLFTQIGSEKHNSILDRNDNTNDFDFKIEEAKDLYKINRLTVADAYYVYLYARRKELGDDYQITFMCNNPICGHTDDKMIVDLSTMDVMCIEDIKDMMVEIELSSGFKSPSGRTIKKVKVNPMTWGQTTTDDFMQCEGEETLLKLYFIENCVSYEDVIGDKRNTLPLAKQQAESLKKFDREQIYQAVNALNLGPSFHIVGECPKCKMPFMWQIDWRYDNFFALSSL